MWKPLLATLLLTATCAAAPATQPATRPATQLVATLVGFASLPADTFGDGPRSGQFITDPAPINGRTPPFDRQPIQGISSMLPTDTPGEYLALSDNGYGTKANSADFLLSVYRVRPDFRTAAGGSGTVKIELAFRLSDPDRKAGFPLVADAATYPNSKIPVPPEISEKRLLTGGDFDPESFVRLPDGTFWVGDEYGPFLLHFSSDGKLLEPPVGLPGEGMHSPDNPLADPKTAKIGRSAGFEGLAYDAPVPDAPLTLEAVLEKPLNEEAGLRIFHFLLDGGRPRVGEAPKQYPRFSEVWGTYPIAPSATAVGEFVCDSSTGIPRQYVAIERDDLQGPAATHKTLAVASERLPIDGTLICSEVADLLNLADTHDLNCDGLKTFRFPFVTPESVVPINADAFLVANDNNYPFSAGRTTGKPDPTEFILIEIDRSLVGG